MINFFRKAKAYVSLKQGKRSMRIDGYKVRNADPMYTLIPRFLTRRYDSMNMITLDVPEEPLRLYMNRKRHDGTPVSHLALIIAAYLRAAAEYPALNRFVGNKTIYQHRDFTVSMVVLRPGEDNDTMSKIYLNMADTIFQVQDKLSEYIEENRKDNNANRFDRTVNLLLSLSVLTTVAIAALRFMDRHGLLPAPLVKASPFHASLLISNLASIRTNHIYHHVYDFGTTSVGITMGNMREVPKKTKDGIVFERCIPLGVVMDERICSGHYFAKAFSRMSEYLSNPALLEQPPQFEVWGMKEAAVKNKN